MKIGIDLDGVVIDSEKNFKTYAEIFDIDTLNGNNLIDPTECKYYNRYNWTAEQKQLYIDKYFLKISQYSNIMAGFIPVYKLLKEQNHEFIVISAKGRYLEAMIDDALMLLEKNNIKFDKYYWKIENKLEICKKENVDLMIDDDWEIVKKLADNNVKTLYLRDVRMKKLEENEYIKEVNNWGEIYRFIKEQEMRKEVNESI